jgi:hypothetical protein
MKPRPSAGGTPRNSKKFVATSAPPSDSGSPSPVTFASHGVNAVIAGNTFEPRCQARNTCTVAGKLGICSRRSGITIDAE